MQTKKFDLENNWPTAAVYKEIARLSQPAKDLELINRRHHSLVWASKERRIVINARQIKEGSEQAENNLKAIQRLAELEVDVLVPIDYSIIDKTLVTVSQLGQSLTAVEVDWVWLGQTLYKLHNISTQMRF